MGNEMYDETFTSAFATKLLDELPSASGPAHYFYPGGTLAGGSDGVVAQVMPQSGAVWIGTFAFGNYGKSAVTKVLNMPDPDHLCVVARGAGYLVSVRDPRRWESLKVLPIIDVRLLAAAKLAVFVNYTELVAYGAAGFRWRTKRLAWDSLKLVEVTDEKIVGEYWDIRADEMRSFEVDVATGAHRGGVESEGGDA